MLHLSQAFFQATFTSKAAVFTWCGWDWAPAPLCIGILPGFIPAMPPCGAAPKAAMFVPPILDIPTMGCCICLGMGLGTTDWLPGAAFPDGWNTNVQHYKNAPHKATRINSARKCANMELGSLNHTGPNLWWHWKPCIDLFWPIEYALKHDIFANCIKNLDNWPKKMHILYIASQY